MNRTVRTFRTIRLTWYLFALSSKDQEEIFFKIDRVPIIDPEDNIVRLPEMALQLRPKVADLPEMPEDS